MADVTKAYAPHKQFFLVAVKARIAAAMTELGMKELDGTPTKNMFQRATLLSESNKAKNAWFRGVVTSIVDKYIINQFQCQQ